MARWAGVVGLVGLGLLWHRVGLADSFVFRGGTMLNAAFTSLVILAGISPTPGPVVGLLGSWPLRPRRPLVRPAAGGDAGAARTVVVALVMIVPVHRSEAKIDFGPAFPDAVVPVGGAEPVARVLLVGDSLSWSMLSGFETWNEAHPDQGVHIDSYRAVACTLAERGSCAASARSSTPPCPA